MVEPTDAELPALNTMGAAADWAALAGADGDEQTPRGSLFALLGTTAAAHPKVVGIHPESLYSEMLNGPPGVLGGGWQIAQPKDGAGKAVPPRPPTFAERGAALLFGTVLRQVAGTQPRAKAVEDAVAKAHDLAVLQAKAGAAKAAGTAGSSDTFKLDMVVNQGIDRELQVAPKTAIDACYASYKAVYGVFPEPRKECTAMQLTALGWLLDNGYVPYIDLALWGPFAGRIFKKLKMRGLVMTGDGELQHVEIGGPPTFSIWEENWEVAITGYVSHKAVPLGTLIRYRGKVADLHRRFGEGAWALIYQADVRMRSEHFERLRRRGEEERAAALAAGGTHLFDPSAPWGWVFDQACSDFEFWKTEVEDVGAAVADRARALAKAVGGDAPLARQQGAQFAPKPPPRSQPLPDASAILAQQAGIRGLREQPPSGPPPKKAKNEPNVQGGVYITSRGGQPLCPAFSVTGECPAPLTRTAQSGCVAGLHLCAKCLGVRHGSAACTKPAPPAVRPKRRAKGGR